MQSSANFHNCSALRWGFPLSRMTTDNLISPLKFCCNTSFILPKQSGLFVTLTLLHSEGQNCIHKIVYNFGLSECNWVKC